MYAATSQGLLGRLAREKTPRLLFSATHHLNFRVAVSTQIPALAPDALHHVAYHKLVESPGTRNSVNYAKASWSLAKLCVHWTKPTVFGLSKARVLYPPGGLAMKGISDKVVIA
jgi:hypothetical protein